MNTRNTIALRLAAIRINAAILYAAISEAVAAVLIPPLPTTVRTAAAGTGHPLDFFRTLAGEVVNAGRLFFGGKDGKKSLGLLGRCDYDCYAHCQDSKKGTEGEAGPKPRTGV